MKTIQQSVDIHGPVEKAFAAMADPKNQMQFDSEMMRKCEKISEGPIGKGTRFRGTFKGMGEMEYEYSDFKENSTIEHAVRMPFGFLRHRFEFKPTPNGTQFTQSMNFQPNFFGKIMWPVAMKGMMTKRLNTLNGLLKNYIEQGK